jgi:hypothetical protein
MVEARRLPRVLKSRHLAMESAVIVDVADRLLNSLSRQDPVAERVELSKPQFAVSALKGAVRGLFSAGTAVRTGR